MIDRKLAAPALALLLAGCGGTGSPGNDAMAANQAAAVPPPANTVGSTPAVDATPGGLLAAYLGKHPSEKVNGVTFLAQPLVEAAVAKVPDAAVREFIIHYAGPDAPIVLRDGRVLAWGCEAHNCGYHNWAISILPDGSSADICYYENKDRPDGQSTWYLGSGGTETRPGNCPSE